MLNLMFYLQLKQTVTKTNALSS